MEKLIQEPELKLCDYCGEPAIVQGYTYNLCDFCAKVYDNKTDYCSLDCCITGVCDGSC